MATTITYTVAECIAKIRSWDAKIEALAGLPGGGRIGRDEIRDTDKGLASAREQRRVWVGRLAAARNGGVYRGTRRVL